MYDRTLAVPVTAATAGAIWRAARVEGLTPSEWVRSAIGRELGMTGHHPPVPGGPNHAAAVELERLVSVEREYADLLAIDRDLARWLAVVTGERDPLAGINTLLGEKMAALCPDCLLTDRPAKGDDS